VRGKSGKIGERPRQLPGFIRIVLGVDTDALRLSICKVTGKIAHLAASLILGRRSSATQNTLA
ncbi:MAG: hypothetical protein AAGF55_15885, partial [Pseudomonadota bacterium]